jgi:hypothetical protein
MDPQPIQQTGTAAISVLTPNVATIPGAALACSIRLSGEPDGSTGGRKTRGTGRPMPLVLLRPAPLGGEKGHVRAGLGEHVPHGHSGSRDLAGRRELRSACDEQLLQELPGGRTSGVTAAFEHGKPGLVLARSVLFHGISLC